MAKICAGRFQLVVMYLFSKQIDTVLKRPKPKFSDKELLDMFTEVSILIKTITEGGDMV